jgi:hypothetical protein
MLLSFLVPPALTPTDSIIPRWDSVTYKTRRWKRKFQVEVRDFHSGMM